ncbi:TetR/AcrR family transcriptional regulator [Yoonia sp. SDW83-1]|uniref:TetR/AcrR family transcriptional regulator n=1 Tax=Yoonia sp. SDW83-1 TaxID=3366945 RepID=UPI00398C7353
MKDTRTKLALKAGLLFQQKGYHGVGVAEILQEAGVPKGSLYHHFPNGKADLALAAADIASTEMLRIIDDSFSPATDYANGATTLCYKLAKFFDIQEGKIGCPVSATLLEGPENATFQLALKEIFNAWMARIRDHAIRLGETPAQADADAQRLFLAIQGGWTLARATRNSDVLRGLPALILSAA